MTSCSPFDLLEELFHLLLETLVVTAVTEARETVSGSREPASRIAFLSRSSMSRIAGSSEKMNQLWLCEPIWLSNLETRVLYLLFCGRLCWAWSCRASWPRRLPSLLWWRRQWEKEVTAARLSSDQPFSCLFLFLWATGLPPVQPKPPVYLRHLRNSTRHSIPAPSNRRHLAVSCPDSQSQNKSIACPRIDINWIKYQCTNKELLMSSAKQQMRVLIIQIERERPICFRYGDARRV